MSDPEVTREITPTQLPLLSMEQGTKTTDDYYTPAWVFERMGLAFDLDVSAPPGGIAWIPAARFYTMGLIRRAA